jgi:hypothetical protein
VSKLYRYYLNNNETRITVGFRVEIMENFIMGDINKLVIEALDIPTSLGASGAAMGGNIISQFVAGRNIKDKQTRERMQSAAGWGGVLGGLAGAYGAGSSSPGAFIASAGLGSLAGGLASGTIARMMQKQKQVSDQNSPIQYGKGRKPN